MRPCQSVVMCILSAVSCTAVFADAVDDFRSLPDNRLAVRQSFGVRYARTLSRTQIDVVIGMSVTGSAANPGAWRVISYQDPNYAYEKFVKPAKATARRELEAEAPAGSPFPRFDRTIVTIELPQPMKPGVQYFVVGQGGANGEMVTAAHTAAQFTLGAADMPSDSAVDLAVLGLRQVEPVGPGLLKLEFGPDFSPEAAAQLSNYTIAVDGKPVKLLNFGRLSTLDTYLPAGWPFAAIPRHEIFLQLDRPLRDGETIDVQVTPAVTLAASHATLRYDAKTSLTNSIKVNQVGYLTDSPEKIAYLGRWMGSFPEGHPNESSALSFPQAPEFHVCSETDGSVVFTAPAKLVHKAGQLDEGYHKVDHSGENVYVLDFTAFKKPGRYFISVPEVGRSLSFAVGDGVYKTAFDVQSYGVFAQRCGIELAPPYSPWHRIACHDKGLMATTQIHGEPHDIKDLAKEVVYVSTGAGEDPALLKLNQDPALVAYYPLNGNLKDASGHGHDLAGADAQFSPDARILPQGNQVLGPSAGGAGGAGNGFKATGIQADAHNGFTISGWFKKDENNDFHGRLFGLGTGEWNQPRMLVTANWGAIDFVVGAGTHETRYARINDGTWHHLALVLASDAQTPRRATLYVDGQSVATGDAGPEIQGDFYLDALTGNGAAGASFDDFRLYSRALQNDEIAILAKPRPAEVPQMIMASGGHHDAGDYNPRSHIDVAQTLMDAYEMAPQKFYDGQLNIPESKNGIPDILDEAYWAMKLWTGLQDTDGGVHNGTESAGDPNFIETVELDHVGDYAYAKDAAGSYTFAGVMAQASRLWRSVGKTQEADDFLARARKAYEWANGHPPVTRTASQRAFQYTGPKAYAAAQLLKTTGDARYNTDFLQACVWTAKPNAEIESYQEYDQSLAAWAYVNCDAKLVDPAIQAAVRKAIIARADTFIANAQTMAYAFIRHPQAPINWGTGAYENYLTPVTWAWRLTGDQKYRYWMLRTCDNTLGANPLNRSYVVGLGTRTVRAPLHNSRYSTLGEVVPGMQVEGPVQSGNGYHVKDVAYPPLRENFASLQTFVDCHFAIDMDEQVMPALAKSMATFGLLLPDHK